MKILYLFTYIIMLCGCSIGGEAPFMVKGSIPKLKSQEPNVCTLNIISPLNNYTDSRVVDDEFSEGFLVYETYFIFRPQPELFLFTVECEDGRKFESSEYLLGSRTFRKFNNGKIDFGELIMK